MVYKPAIFISRHEIPLFVLLHYMTAVTVFVT